MEAAPATGHDRRRRSHAAAYWDEDVEDKINPFDKTVASAPSKIQFRNVSSRARWVEEAGAAEVLESKGKLWLTTGITRGGKLYYNVEEIGFLAEIGTLILLDDKDETIGREDIYEMIAGEDYGCSWDAFQAYKHLKSLGYIVGRFSVPWTMKPSGTCAADDRPASMVDTAENINTIDSTCNDITELFKKTRIDGISPCFEVYLPNSKFKKSSPGPPSFLLCLLRDKPPTRVELEAVENSFGGIPLKYCHVDNGRVSFLSFDKVTLPSLP